MGLLHKCPSCHKRCDQRICNRENGIGHETLLLECSECKYTWFVTMELTEVCNDIKECPKCGSYETDINESPWIYDTYMKLNQECCECGHQWTGLYKLPERIGVEDESDPPED